MKQSFDNIPAIGLACTQFEEEQVIGLVSQRTHGMMSFTHFSIMQFIAGAEQLVRDSVTASTDIKPEIVNIMSKLFRLGINLEKCLVMSKECTEINTNLQRGEVMALRTLIEARISHCEHERDTRKPEFSADTYIGQKLMLIEIREWLSVTLIKVEKEDKQASVTVQAAHSLNCDCNQCCEQLTDEGPEDNREPEIDYPQ